MRRIKNITVLGSGIMGSGIACHLANAGFSVLMLDIIPNNLTENQLKNPEARNSQAAQSLQKAMKSSPSPLYSQEFAKRINIGNFEDDLHKIADSDWIIEVIVERLDIKRTLFEKVDNLRKPGTLVTSNTSGIPIHMMSQGRSEDFKKHFFGTHFFNPARYMQLLEIIPTEDTDPDIIDFFMEFGDTYLGKETVRCKDTPAFIGNRIGVTSMAKVFELTGELGLYLHEVDKLTGPAIGRPKTGTFRLGDLVGLDTAVKVMQDLRDHCPDDEEIQKLQIPEFLSHLIRENHLGNKTGQGFYKKTAEKDDKGKSVILELDLQTLEYHNPPSSGLKSLQTSKQIEDIPRRLAALWKMEDKGAELIRKSLAFTFLYAAARIPEISDDIYSIDDAMKAGFAWSYGPFEYADAIGVDNMVQVGTQMGMEIPEWVSDFQRSDSDTFYKLIDNVPHYYDIGSRTYAQVPGKGIKLKMSYFKSQDPVFSNDEIILQDLGDGVLGLEFISKSNTIGEGVLRGIGKAIDMAESGHWQGLVIANDGKNFTVGANLMLIGSLAYQQEFDQLNAAVKLFQDTSMRIRTSRIPVVAATQGYVFGGGCEFVMHTDSSVVSAESYVGLVEVGVGLLPGGGGSKEFAVRASDAYKGSTVANNILMDWFKVIAMGEVSTSAHQAVKMGYLNQKDQIVIQHLDRISLAKKTVLDLAKGYVAPSVREDIKVLGRSGLGTLELGINELRLGRYASEHDALIAGKIAHILCGGDLSEPQEVSETYLLDLEREAFLSLCTEQKTLERIQHMLETGKPLRN